jgi:putative ABC transport system substrate-binding protein
MECCKMGLKTFFQYSTILSLCAVLFAFCFPAEAQQPKKVPRIGMLMSSSAPSQKSRLDDFRDGLREVGYVERQNILIEYRYANGKLDQLPALVAELVGLKVDLIVTTGNEAVQAAKNTTQTLPIVMAFSGDPVAAEFVASLSRPGGKRRHRARPDCFLRRNRPGEK